MVVSDAPPRSPVLDGETPLAELARFWSDLRRIVGRSEKICLDAGTTHLQFQALLAIATHPGAAPPTITDLSDSLGLRHNTAVELASRLEAAGWVARQRLESNRRRVLLTLTPDGRSLLAALAAAHAVPPPLERVGRPFGVGP
jgi:DNA-binding MarR family transcriptional regulator